MKELVVREGISLLDIPSGEAVYGIVLPTAKQLTKDGFGIATQKDTYRANRIFKIARKIGEYTTEYGARVFYLGTYTNPSGGNLDCLVSLLKINIRIFQMLQLSVSRAHSWYQLYRSTR